LQSAGGSYVLTPKTTPSKPDNLSPFELPILAQINASREVRWHDAHSTSPEPRLHLPLYLAHQLLLL
jgi:hypothetical protein